MGLAEIVLLYIAILIVVFLHELGHIPKRIKWISFLPLPSAAAMDASWREGGLFVNVLLFLSIYAMKPESILILLVGAVAWIHFIAYSILGSIVPEPKNNQVNLSTYVWDDVANKYWYLFIPAGALSFLLLKSYYLPIFSGVLTW